MSYWLQSYYTLLNFSLKLLVKSRSIPVDFIGELKLDVSRPIIYILPYASKIDLLTLRIQCLKHRLPDPLKPLIINNMKLDRYIYIQNNSYKFSYHILKEESEIIKTLYDYLYINSKNSDLDVQIVSVYIMFGRNPNNRKIKINLLPNIAIFNGIYKLFLLICFGRDSFVYFSSSISLRWILTKYNFDKTILYKLTRVARIHFTRQRLATIGPSLPTRQDLLKKLITSKEVISAVKDEARNKKISYKEAKENAITLIEEIAANLSYKMVYLIDRILKFTWNHLYQRINVHNVELVRQIAYSGHEIVYVPCHRSHMDYLLLSYVLYNHGLVLPHIAAGINLNFWPAGPIFRRLGAFFIRRTFKSNKLYSILFREYLGELFNHGFSVEYFLEGGRSRTGRLLEPKTGALSITIQTMLRGKTRPITLVPIYIGYEHIIEVSGYINELRGADKKKESLPKIIKVLSKLRNLGQVYVNFGEPLTLINWLNQHVPNWRKSVESIETVMRPSWLIPTVNGIATDLMIRINNAVSTNAMNLCYTAFLSSDQSSFTRSQLIEQLECYLDLMRNVPYSAYSTIPSISANALIDYVLKMNKFGVRKNNANDNIILPRNQLMSLAYYRNNITHMLVLPSLIASIIIHYCRIPYHSLIRYINVLYPMLKAELFLCWKRDDLSLELCKLTKELIRQELIILKKGELQVNPSRFNILKLLAAGANSTLQRYTITFWLLSTNPFVNRGKLEEKSQAIACRLSTIHNINAPEFFDKSIFSTLMLTLREEGYIKDNGDIKLEEIITVYQMISKLIAPDILSTIKKISK